MPNLIVTEASLKMAAEKLAGSPIYGGPDGKFIDPGVVNLVEGNENPNPWIPADNRTKQMVLGADVCRDILLQADSLLKRETRPRAMKNTSVQLCSLMDVVDRLVPLFNDESSRSERTAWPKRDQQSYEDCSRRIRKNRFKSPLRKVRNTFGAHPDSKVFLENPSFTVEDFLEVLGDGVVVLEHCLGHSSGFNWIRGLGRLSDGRRVVQQMISFPVCSTWITDEEGNTLDILPMEGAVDPRKYIQEPILQLSTFYNDFIRATGSHAPEIWVRSTQEVLDEEAGLISATAS